MKKNHEKGDDHVTQSKKIRARLRWRTFQCMISRILIKSDDYAFLEEFGSEFQCQMIMSHNQRKFAEGMYGFVRSLQLCK